MGQEEHSRLSKQHGKRSWGGSSLCKIERRHTWQLAGWCVFLATESFTKTPNWKAVTACGNGSNSAPGVSTPPVPHVDATSLTPEGALFTRL